MLNQATKWLFGFGVAAIVASFVYGVATNDGSGATALAFVAAGAVALGAVAISAGPDRAPVPTAEGPLPHNLPAGSRPQFPSIWPLATAAAIGLLAIGAATNGVVVGAGVVFVVAVGLGWLFQGWTEHPRFTARFGSRLTDRLLVPLGMPLAAFGLVLVIGLSVSRVLLAVPESGSRLVALVVAVVILASGFIVAAQERMARAALAVLCSLALVAVVAAGITGLASGERHFERKGGVAGPVPTAAAVPISASGTTSFDVTALSFPADATVPLVFDNQTVGVPHNVGIYDHAGGKELFAGKIVTGPTKVTYDVPPLQPGTYVFHCDVHPNMSGTLTVAATAAPPATTGTTVGN